jgi:hypothetical protein
MIGSVKEKVIENTPKTFAGSTGIRSSIFTVLGYEAIRCFHWEKQFLKMKLVKASYRKRTSLGDRHNGTCHQLLRKQR